MADVELAPEAERDLLNIALYGIETFGIAGTEQYIDGLKTRFKAIAEHPLRYPAVDSNRQGYRRSVYRSHAIYYRIEGRSIAVMRILGWQNLETAFRYPLGD